MAEPSARGKGALDIAFLDSWRTGAWDGSGTAVGISGLRHGLETLGHRVEVLRPPAGPARSSHGLAGRLAYNWRLPRRLHDLGGKADLIVGFDLDGVRWSRRRPRNAPPYLVSLKGIADDEARFAASRSEALHLRLLGALERRNARGADRVLVPSRYSEAVAKDRYGIDPDRIRVVPEAVDTTPFEALRRTRPPRPEAPTVLSVARQYPRKDTATLLRALPLVRERIPEVRLRIIGGGPELPRLLALARELRLGRSVAFEGAVPDDAEVHRAYFEAHVFCLPSRQEGFGIVFVEAMAAGLPIVAARAGAVPEVVEEGTTGLLVPPRSPEPLADALIRLLEDDAERERLAAAGPERARRFAPGAIAERFLDAVPGRSLGV